MKGLGLILTISFNTFFSSTYVLPTLWSISLFLLYGYVIVSLFRVWVAKEEGKIQQRSFVLWIIASAYVVISFAFLSTIFAVKAIAKDSHTLNLHTVPYTNILIALFVLDVQVTWFGEKVAWKDMKLPKCFLYFNRYVNPVRICL